MITDLESGRSEGDKKRREFRRWEGHRFLSADRESSTRGTVGRITMDTTRRSGKNGKPGQGNESQNFMFAAALPSPKLEDPGLIPGGNDNPLPLLL